MRALGGQSEARGGLSPGPPWLCHPCSLLGTVASQPRAGGLAEAAPLMPWGFQQLLPPPPASPPPSFAREFPPSAFPPERLSRAGEAFQGWSLQARPESLGREAGARNAACGFAHPTGMLCIPRSCRSSTQIRASSLIAQALAELCEHVKYYMSIYLYNSS